MKRTLWCCAISGLLLASTHVSAAWYGSVATGWQDAEPMQFDALSAKLDYDFRALSPALELGWTVRDHWRLELEGSYRETKAEWLYFQHAGIHVDPQADDKTKAVTLMFNGMRDFRVGLALEPYVGFGLGPAWVSVEVGENDETDPGTGVTFIDDSGWALAYQVIAGVNLPLSRRFDMALDYRYWRALSVGLTDELGGKQDVDYALHMTRLHLRYWPGRTVSEGWWRRTEPEPGGFYVTGSLGAGRAQDAEMASIHTDLDAFSIGPVGSVAAGFATDRRWRFEIEASRRRHTVQVMDFGFHQGERLAKGHVRAESLTFNAVYRFRPEAAIRPTAAVGAGVVRARYDVDLELPDEPFMHDSDTASVFQFGVGLDIALAQRLTLTTDYRMWITSSFDLQTSQGEPVDPRHVVHSTVIGLRYTF